MTRSSLMIVAVLIGGCDALEEVWSGGGCESDQKSAIKRYGQPDDVDTYRASGQTTETYWWWSRGQSVTYKWSDGSRCDKSTFSFTPIR